MRSLNYYYFPENSSSHLTATIPLLNTRRFGVISIRSVDKNQFSIFLSFVLTTQYCCGIVEAPYYGTLKRYILRIKNKDSSVAQKNLRHIETLKSQRRELVEQLTQSPTWAVGSFRQTLQYNKGYPNAGHSHQFISRRVEGRYKSTYVRKSQIENARRAIEWRRQVDAMMNQIAEINIEIIKLGGQL